EVDGQVNAEPEERFDERIFISDVIEVVVGTYRGYTDEPDYIEQGHDHMLRRARRGPVAWQEEGEDHCGEKCVPEPEAAPDPKRKDTAGGGNQELNTVQLRRIRPAAEKSGPHSRTEKTNRVDGERFLDPIPIQMGLGNGEFGGDIADGSENQEENAGDLLRWPRKKNSEEECGSGAHADQGEEEQDQPQKDAGGAQLGDRFLLQTLVLPLGEEALAGPVRQEFAGAQSFFA